jgi:predicted ABC-type transport system involved in lysophospholipase L1 biosynthesis ATPase subunit
MNKNGSGAVADAAISCKGLWKSFASKAETLQVLRGLDMQLPGGSSCSIVGLGQKHPFVHSGRYRAL